MNWVFLAYVASGLFVLVLAYMVFGRERKQKLALGLDLPRLNYNFQPAVHTQTSPVSGICSECGESITMPFKCKFCGELFCGEHRLPENHGCNGFR